MAVVKLLLFPIVFLLSLSLIAAESADFTASAPERINACSCDSVQQQIKVTNTGSSPALYTVQQSGSGAALASISPASFVLLPNASLSLLETVNAPCRTERSYELKTTVTNDFSVAKSFTQGIAVAQCTNAAVIINPVISSGCRCSTFFYEAEVKNTDGFADTFTLSTDRNDIAVIAPAALRLQEGETQKAYLTINPSCDVSGRQEVLVVAASQNSADKATAVAAFTADPVCTAYPLPEPEMFGFDISFDISTGALLPLLGLPLLFIVAVLAAIALRAAPREKKQPKQERYKWQSMFEAEPKPGAERADHTILFIVLAIIGLLGLIFFTALYIGPQLGGNETMNITVPLPPETTEPLPPETAAEETMNVTALFPVPSVSLDIRSPATLAAVVLAVAAVLLLMYYSRRKPATAMEREAAVKKEAVMKKDVAVKAERAVKKAVAKKTAAAVLKKEAAKESQRKKEAAAKEKAKKEKKKAAPKLSLPKLPLARIAAVIVVAILIISIAAAYYFRSSVLPFLQASPSATFLAVAALAAAAAVIAVVLIGKGKVPAAAKAKPLVAPLQAFSGFLILLGILFGLYWFRTAILAYLRTKADLAFYILLGLVVLAVLLALLRLRRK